MVCTADDLLGWKDFPKGLRILLLDEDSSSAEEIKSKLEEMDYIVDIFCNENEALTAISREPESFHVAILEVSTGNQHGCFKFLETAKDLPTIMTSNIQCLSTMMKCIALGAAEFLPKPLSEDKLRNIWQHVVHKAFNGGESAVPKSLKPIKETVDSMLQLQQDSNEADNKNLLETDDSWQAHECDHEQPTISDRFPAPSTPQLKQGDILLDDGDCQDLLNCSLEKERGDLQEESKSVETTCNNLVAETNCNTSVAEVSIAGRRVDAVKEEDSLNVSKIGSSLSQQLYKDSTVNSSSENENSKKASPQPVSRGSKANRKKMKVDWTPELHKQFVKAVEQLGVDQAIPSRILELMKVEGLTRHNVASHLQKYRMHKRHILPKEDDRRWQHPIDPMQRVYAQKPIIAYPTYHPNHGLPASQYYPVWGHPSTHLSGGQMWGHPSYPAWHHRPDIWPWKTHPGMHVDAWSYPMIPQSQAPYSNFPQVQNAYGFNYFHSIEDSNNIPKSSLDFHLDEEQIDKVVNEAMSKPWLPLPLGLKAPSTESVLSELHRQGISNIPPHSQC